MSKKLDKNIAQAVLCYAAGPWAYFTTLPLHEQDGDGWNDAPYEYNSGRPYSHYTESGKEHWDIIKVAWDGYFSLPCNGHTNSPWSVYTINAGVIAWLLGTGAGKKPVVIHAGTTLEKFCELVTEGGGHTYLSTK